MSTLICLLLTVSILAGISDFCNREWGSGDDEKKLSWLPKPMLAVLWGGTIAAFAGYKVWEAWHLWYVVAASFILIPVGVYIRRVFGKGKGFPHNDKDTSGEPERIGAIADPLTNATMRYKYVPGNTLTTGQILNWKTVWTGYAWSVCAILQYVIMCGLFKSYVPLVGIVAMLPIGLIYRHYFDKYPNVIPAVYNRIKYSEKRSGAWMGAVDGAISVLA